MSFWAVFLFVFATIGLTHILVDSTIFASVRQFWKNHLPLAGAWECHQCMGWYSGLICSFFVLLYDGIPLLTLRNFLAVLPLLVLFGCAGSYLSMLGRSLLDWLNFSINIPIGEPSEDTDSSGN